MSALHRATNFTIYALIDPDRGCPRYVGQTADTLQNRLQDHLRPNRSKRSEWIQALLADGKIPLIRELAIVAGSRKHAYEAESLWIRQLRAGGEDLLNT